MTGIPIPPPQEPLKPEDSDRANDVWYRYWDGQSRSINNLTTSVAALSSAVSAITTVSTTGTINSGTVQATTGGTEVTFTDIPSSVRRLTITFDSVALSSVGHILVRLGTTTAIVTSGYIANSIGVSSVFSDGASGTTNGFPIYVAGSIATVRGQMSIIRITGNDWVASHSVARSSVSCSFGGGRVSLSGELGRASILSSDTANNLFRLGQANIHWEF